MTYIELGVWVLRGELETKEICAPDKCNKRPIRKCPSLVHLFIYREWQSCSGTRVGLISSKANAYMASLSYLLCTLHALLVIEWSQRFHCFSSPIS